MFHGTQINNKINKLHERALRVVYNDTITTFEELLVKDKTFTIHHKNIQSLAVEMYKAVNNYPEKILGNFLQEIITITIFALYKNQQFQVSILSLKVLNSISYFGSVTWNSIPAELTGINPFQVFESQIKVW